ncbi:hypothetical protein CN586_08535 [Bacillus toyonensis]|uniref:hypothetical protein n=1 Tax=Bacillus toyonensis TaxID=155322 RepID=UPI000BF042C8|nr:hypothetical protein [Bacillus toyonensis]PEK51542.1 hypothetical protein CN586_08535 [Bacillus toyonensis]
MKQLEQYFTEEFLKTYDYHELHIDKFRKVINHSKVITPLEYLLNVEPQVGVCYETYLYVKAVYCKLKKNTKALGDIQEYWDVFVKE